MPEDEPGATTFEGGLLDWPLLLVFVLGVGLVGAAPFLENDVSGALLMGTACLSVSLPVLTTLTRRRVTIDPQGVEIANLIRTRLEWGDLAEVGVAKRGPKLFFAERGRMWRIRGVYARDFPAREALLAISELLAESHPTMARSAHDKALTIPKARTPTAPERWLRRWGSWLSLAVLAATAVTWVLLLG